MRWYPLLLIPLVGCQPAAPAHVEVPADSAAGETPIEWAGPNQAALMVPVHVNGTGPYDFVVDTGATLTCVSHTLASELDLPRPGGRIGVGAGVGGSGRIELVRIDSLRVGGARAEDLSACAIDLSAAERVGVTAHGLLGLNFLRSYRVTFDFERDVLILQAP